MIYFSQNFFYEVEKFPCENNDYFDEIRIIWA